MSKEPITGRNLKTWNILLCVTVLLLLSILAVLTKALENERKPSTEITYEEINCPEPEQKVCEPKIKRVEVPSAPQVIYREKSCPKCPAPAPAPGFYPYPGEPDVTSCIGLDFKEKGYCVAAICSPNNKGRCASEQKLNLPEIQYYENLTWW